MTTHVTSATDTYARASRDARMAIVNTAVRQASDLLTVGRKEEAMEILYQPKVVRAWKVLHPEMEP